MIVFIIACIIGTILGTRLAYAATGRGFIPKALKPKKRTPDYSIIAELEELNQIEGREGSSRPQDVVKEIEGLAGYKTKIRRDAEGDLELSLIDAGGKRVDHGWVMCKDYVDAYAHRKELLPASQIEKRVKKKFAAMIEDERVRLEQKRTMDGLIEKFNNKAVNL